MDYELQLFELLHTATGRFWKLIAPLIKKSGFSFTDMIVVNVLGKRRTIQVTTLAAIIGVPASTCTGILDRLEKQGFLKREQNPADRRSVVVHALPKLDSMLKNLKMPAEETLRRVFRSVPENRLKRVVEDLKVILDSMEKPEDGDSCNNKGVHT